MTEKEKNLSEAELHDICEKYMEELGICDDPKELYILIEKIQKEPLALFLYLKKYRILRG